jgi:predicted transcriptional regulator
MVARVTISLPEELLARLDAVADELGVTRSEIVREAGAVYVTQRDEVAVRDARLQRFAEDRRFLDELRALPGLDGRPSLEILHEVRQAEASAEPPSTPRGGGTR